MPEFLAPGVFIEETLFRGRSIEGVPTATAGFVGPARYGPVDGVPILLTSLADYERVHGGRATLAFADAAGESDDYLWHAARAFFEEGGKRLYVARVFAPAGDGDPASACARTATLGFAIRARFPGRAGDAKLTITLQRSPDRSGSAQPEPPVLDASRITASVKVDPGDGLLPVYISGDLRIDPAPASASESLFDHFGDGRTAPVVFERPGSSGADVLATLIAARGSPEASAALASALLDAGSPPSARSVILHLGGGSDGARPPLAAYEGAATPLPSGLRALETADEIAIVAAPGSTGTDDARADAVTAALIAHAERMRFRIAIVDSIRGHGIAAVRAFRARHDSSYAALHYPWVQVADPRTGAPVLQPPSGFVAGIYARHDVEHAVYKPPANAVVRLATGFERSLGRAQQEVLNPEGINCFRVFEGRGLRLWGARTMTGDPDWKYVHVRRYVAFLEHSIDRGTGWTVFEPNGEPLWANVRRAVEDFLDGEWRNGALLGDTPEHAYFVRCDRSTTTQDDIDEGRLVCLVGLALLEPAEFLILRIVRRTAMP